jgi:hypothetical protein
MIKVLLIIRVKDCETLLIFLKFIPQMLHSFTVSIVENKDSVFWISIDFCRLIYNLQRLATSIIRNSMTSRATIKKILEKWPVAKLTKKAKPTPPMLFNGKFLINALL